MNRCRYSLLPNTMYTALSTGSLELKDEDISITKYPKLVAFEDKFRDPDDQVPLRNRISHFISKHIASCNVKKSCYRYFPVIRTLKTYAWKQDLPNDFVAGIIAGVMMIPQGMAFAALSTLPPIVGLYISFFASITYFLFGTGRQLSWGCIAILSLMMATILEKYDKSLEKEVPVVCINGTAETVTIFSSSLVTNSTNFTSFSIGHSEDVMAKRIEVASGVSFIAGLILIVASRVGLSRITCIMSNSLITGFTVGISFHVATSQLKTIFGLSIKRYEGIGAIVQTWISVLINLPKTNVATLLISVLSMLVIYLVKRFINDKFKNKLRVPVPIELLVVIVATLISNFAYLHDQYDVKVVEEVPVGLPAPKFPDLSLITDYIRDGIVIIIIAYAQTLAMAKTMGLKHHYVVDSDQEMMACGACAVVCSFFSGYISAASVSRSVVQDGAGGKTQLASLFAAGLVLLVILVIGPYFYYLPMCVLSAIIIVNLYTMFLKLLEIPKEWRKSRYDCAVWVFACFSCVVLNADIGLLAGVIFSLALVVLRSMLSPVVEAGQIQTSPLTVELRSVEKYSSARVLHNVKIIKIKTPLYFINSDIFTAKVFSKTDINPTKIKKQRKQKELLVSQALVEAAKTDGLDDKEPRENGSMLSSMEVGKEVSVVLLDAAEVSFIDLMGIQALQFLINEFTSVDVEVLISSVPENIIPMMKSSGFWQKNGDRLFLSVESALVSIVTAVKINKTSISPKQNVDDSVRDTEMSVSPEPGDGAD